MIFRLECEIRDLQEEKKVLERKGHGRLKVQKSIYVILTINVCLNIGDLFRLLANCFFCFVTT